MHPTHTTKEPAPPADGGGYIIGRADVLVDVWYGSLGAKPDTASQTHQERWKEQYISESRSLFTIAAAFSTEARVLVGQPMRSSPLRPGAVRDPVRTPDYGSD